MTFSIQDRRPSAFYVFSSGNQEKNVSILSTHRLCLFLLLEGYSKYIYIAHGLNDDHQNNIILQDASVLLYLVKNEVMYALTRIILRSKGQ